MPKKILLNRELMSFLQEGIANVEERIPKYLSYVKKEGVYTFSSFPCQSMQNAVEKFTCPVCGSKDSAIFPYENGTTNGRSANCTNCGAKIARSLFHLNAYNMRCYSEDAKCVQFIQKKQNGNAFFMAVLCIYSFQNNQYVGSRINHILFCGEFRNSIANERGSTIYVNKNPAKINRIIKRGTLDTHESSWNEEMFQGGIDAFVLNSAVLRDEKQLKKFKDAVLMRREAHWNRTTLGEDFNIADFWPAAYPEEFEKRARERLAEINVEQQFKAMRYYSNPSSRIMQYARVMLFEYADSTLYTDKEQTPGLIQRWAIKVHCTCPNCGERQSFIVPTTEGLPPLFKAASDLSVANDVFIQNSSEIKKFNRQCPQCGFQQDAQIIGKKTLRDLAPEMMEPLAEDGDTTCDASYKMEMASHILAATIERTTLLNDAFLIRFFFNAIIRRNGQEPKFEAEERIRIFILKEGIFIFHNSQCNADSWRVIQSYSNDEKWEKAAACAYGFSRAHRISAEALISRCPIYMFQPESQQLLDEMYCRFGYPSELFLIKENQKCLCSAGIAINFSLESRRDQIQSGNQHDYRFAKAMVKSNLRHIAMELFLNARKQDIYETAIKTLEDSLDAGTCEMFHVKPDTIQKAAEHHFGIQEMLMYDEFSKREEIEYKDFVYVSEREICKKVLDIMSATGYSATKCVSEIRALSGESLKSPTNICDEWLEDLKTHKEPLQVRHEPNTDLKENKDFISLLQKANSAYIDPQKLPKNIFTVQDKSIIIEPIDTQAAAEEISAESNRPILSEILDGFRKRGFAFFRYFLAKVIDKASGRSIGTIMMGATTNTTLLKPEFFIWEGKENSDDENRKLMHFFQQWCQKAEVTLKLP